MYYFSKTDKKLRYNDERVIKEGITHKVEGELELCQNGLHASERALDALKYAPGPYLWIVELGGDIVKGDDKCCARERKYIKGFDASESLREFARKCALINIEKIKPYCSDDDYRLIIEYLNTGREDIREAAMSAAEAARLAAWESADSAAEAANSAAGAARSAAWESAEAAMSAAMSAAWSADSAAEAAAWSARSAAEAAYSAAWSAAWSELNEIFENMLNERL